MQTIIEYNSTEKIFLELSKYIDSSDYSSYTLAYPPFFLTENDVDTQDIFSSINTLKEPLGLYVHIPFCNTKCTFCRYFSFVNKNTQTYEKYVDYLIKELSIYKEHFPASKIFNSLYIGGGTPNIIGAKNLDRLLTYIFENVSFSPDFQFCIEFNPHESDNELLDVIKKHGVHRLTIGIQSMDEKVLENINREQTKKDVLRTIDYAKKIGIPYVNTDLMLGIKGQTLKSFIKDLQILIHLKVDMIHLHNFIATDRTIDPEVDAETEILQEQMKRVGIEMLKNAGYKSPDGDAMCLDTYSENKQLTDAIYGGKYLGIGVSAVGFLGEKRYINVPTLPKYFSKLDEGKLPIEFICSLSKRDNMVQYIVYGMRYGKISLNRFTQTFDCNLLKEFKQEIYLLEERDKVFIEGDFLYCKFSTVWDYLVFSKYFYDPNIIENYIAKFPKTT